MMQQPPPVTGIINNWKEMPKTKNVTQKKHKQYPIRVQTWTQMLRCIHDQLDLALPAPRPPRMPDNF